MTVNETQYTQIGIKNVNFYQRDGVCENNEKKGGKDDLIEAPVEMACDKMASNVRFAKSHTRVLEQQNAALVSKRLRRLLLAAVAVWRSKVVVGRSGREEEKSTE